MTGIADSTSGLGVPKQVQDNSQVQEKKTDLMEKLASGKQINSASDGGAAQQIIDRFTSQIEGNRQALSNVYDGISLTQVAEGGLEGINNDVSRIRELTLQSGNGMLNDADKRALQSEISALQENISRSAEQTTFAGKPLLTEQSALRFQAGADAGGNIDVQTNDVVKEIASVLNIDVTTNSVNDALAATDAALETVGAYRAELGAAQNQLASSARSLTQADVNTSAAQSRIADTDYAQASSQQAALDVQRQAVMSVQSMATQQEGQVLALLS
ncbi:flagellin [Salinimonas sp. HHU 13199]|uniref:Flagellin n=1 Tax=Salinimonas profundi TaxID=2729140 RepID=A0ABR8LIF1_9ALTE|nr:flagellin [Salinimonas profundi]MBD3585338.1 flagellin [Salinimonas profundi]